MAAVAAASSTKGRDIGSIPPIANVDRRESCRFDFKLFCETYNPEAFSLPWSEDQVASAKRSEESILAGGLFAEAAPRGDGKTTRARMACLWGLSYAHRRYLAMIGSNSNRAADNLEAVKTMMRFLPKFVADFPEIAVPVIKLGGIAQRAGGQLCGGQPTLIEWSATRICLPTVPPPANWPAGWPLRPDGMVPTSGSLCASAGLTSDGLRGLLITLDTGEFLRPDFVLADDPQTRESAHSPTQNSQREQLIAADLLGLAGPGKTIAAHMPCTVIAKGDMVDNILDRKKHPLWRGVRTKMLRSMPKNMKAWEEYFDVYAECAQQDPPDMRPANDYYVAHRKVLDAGAEAAWEHRKRPDEVSAVQSAMHLYFRDKRAFAAEYQNEPETEELLTEVRQLTEADLSAKLDTLPKGLIPRGCNKLTAFIDLQQEVLFWAVCGWTDRFGGALVDYGAFPSQKQPVFTAAEPRPKLSDVFPNGDRATRLYAGLEKLVPVLLGHAFKQSEGNGSLTVSMLMIDTGFEGDVVHDFISRSPLKALLHGSKGRGIGAAGKPMADYRKDPGDRVGWNWRIDAKTAAKGRLVSYDTNAWKSFLSEAMLAANGSASAFHLPGTKIAEHPLLKRHLLSEYRVPTYGQGRRVEEWKMRPNQRENHWLDCIVGCAVAASVQGVAFSASGLPVEKPEPPKPIKLSDMQRQRVQSSTSATSATPAAAAAPSSPNAAAGDAAKPIKLSDLQNRSRGGAGARRG